MGILDDAKGALGEHSDKVEDGIDTVADVVDDKTGGKYSDNVDQAQDIAKDWVADQAEKSN